MSFFRSRFHLSWWVALGCLLVLWILGSLDLRASSSSARAGKSLLIVVVDTLRYDAGDPGGSPEFLRGRGTQFRNAVAASDWTSPSVVALMTGRLPSDCGLVGASWTTQFPLDWTLAQKLRGAGYRTAAVVSNPTIGGTRLGLAAGFDTWDDKMTGTERNRPTGVRTAPETTDAALAAIAEVAGGKDKKPWFFWVQYLQPHGPYAPPSPYPQNAADPGTPIPVAVGDTAGRGELPHYQYLAEARGRNDYATRYRSSAAWSLDEADRFLRTADSKGYLKDATVVFTADHGEFLGEDDYWFQHGVRIHPAVVRVPLVIARSTTEKISIDKRPVSLLDLVPTLTKLLDLRGGIPPELPGIDLFDAKAARKGPILVENIEFPNGAAVGAVIGDRFVVKSTDDAPEGFKVDGASWEASGSELTPPQTAVVDAELRRVRKLPIPTREVPPEDVQKLRALGYIH